MLSCWPHNHHKTRLELVDGTILLTNAFFLSGLHIPSVHKSHAFITLLYNIRICLCVTRFVAPLTLCSRSTALDVNAVDYLVHPAGGTTLLDCKRLQKDVSLMRGHDPGDVHACVASIII